MSDWVGELKKTPEKVISMVYKEYRASALAWLSKNYNLEKQDGLDVFQNAVTALYQNAILDKISDRGVAKKTYLFAICKNLALKHKAKSRISYFDTLEALAFEPSNHELEKSENQIKACINGIERLSASCRDLLRSFYLEQRKIPEITLIYQYSSENSAKTQKYKCLKKLRELMITSKVE